MVHFPAASSFAAAPEVVQIVGVMGEKLTINPEVEVACNAMVSPTSDMDGDVNLICWLAGDTRKLWLTAGIHNGPTIHGNPGHGSPGYFILGLL
jgi:hypothetical protein